VVDPQDFTQPLEALGGEFSWLTGFQFVTVTGVPVMLAIPVMLSGANISAICPSPLHV
jgi:hypothetical protein